MTLVGKIFTVLIFIMSIVFMSFAVMVFATHKNWKEVALSTAPGKEGLLPKLQALEAQNQALAQKLISARNELAEHQAARRMVLANLQTQVATATKDLAKTEGLLQKLQSDHTEVAAQLTVAETELKKVVADNTTLRTDIVTIQEDRDNKLARVVSLGDQVNQAQTKLTQLEERKQQLIAQVAFQKMTMEANNIDISAPLPNTLERPVDGVVTAVGEKNLIEISIGIDDGLREGHELQVYRQNKYLGKVTVRKVTANRAVAEIDPKLLQAPIRKGDRVASKLS